MHLFNGVFGTLCVGLFAVDKITGAATGNGLFNGGGMTLLIAQLKGIVAVGVYTLVVSFVFWYADQGASSACASARKRKKKVSTSASTARRPTSDSRRKLSVRRKRRSRLNVFLTEAGGAGRAAGSSSSGGLRDRIFVLRVPIDPCCPGSGHGC